MRTLAVLLVSLSLAGCPGLGIQNVKPETTGETVALAVLEAKSLTDVIKERCAKGTLKPHQCRQAKRDLHTVKNALEVTALAVSAGNETEAEGRLAQTRATLLVIEQILEAQQ